MKKIICLALALLVVLSLAACGNFDQKAYFIGTWTCEENKADLIPASTMTFKDDYTGVLEYGDVTYNFEWVNHPSMPEIVLIKKMVDDQGETHVPTEKIRTFRCPNCYLETNASKIKNNTCPKKGCGTQYPPEFDVTCVLRCTYTLYNGTVSMIVNDGDGHDKIDKLTLLLDKQP